jgi:hypothetical protein
MDFTPKDSLYGPDTSFGKELLGKVAIRRCEVKEDKQF